MITGPEAHMAMLIPTWLHLLTLEQVAGRDVEPAGNCLHQLIAGDREAIDIAAAGKRIPGMCQCRNGSDQRRNNKQCQSHQRNSLSAAQTNPVGAPALGATRTW
jgi:hypothetical protein